MSRKPWTDADKDEVWATIHRCKCEIQNVKNVERNRRMIEALEPLLDEPTMDAIGEQ